MLYLNNMNRELRRQAFNVWQFFKIFYFKKIKCVYQNCNCQMALFQTILFITYSKHYRSQSFFSTAARQSKMWVFIKSNLNGITWILNFIDDISIKYTYLYTEKPVQSILNQRWVLKRSSLFIVVFVRFINSY